MLIFEEAVDGDGDDRRQSRIHRIHARIGKVVRHGDSRRKRLWQLRRGCAASDNDSRVAERGELPSNFWIAARWDLVAEKRQLTLHQPGHETIGLVRRITIER